MRIILILLILIVGLVGSDLKSYENTRFGFSGKYPSNIFVKEFHSDNNDGVILSSQNGHVKCILSGINNVIEESLKDEYKSTLESASKANKEITYKVLKKDWYVLSGYNNDMIFYQKRFLTKGTSESMGVFSSFYIEYPIKDKKKYNKLVQTINKNFKPAIASNILIIENNITPNVEREKVYALDTLYRIVNHHNTDLTNKKIERSLIGKPVSDVCVVEEVDENTLSSGYHVECEAPSGQILKLFTEHIKQIEHLHRGDRTNFTGTIKSIKAENDVFNIKSLYIDL